MPCTSGRKAEPAVIDQRFLAGQKFGGKGDAAKFVVRLNRGAVQPRAAADPAAFATSRAVTRGDQIFLPDFAVELPDAEPDQDGDADQRKDGGLDHAAPARAESAQRVAPLLEPAFGGLVMKLQRDQQALDRPQRPERHDQDQRQPQHRVHPIRRLVDHLGDQRGEHDDGAADQDDEHRRPVAGIGEVEIEPAGSQRARKPRKPWNSCPLPQRGQRPARPLAIGSGWLWPCICVLSKKQRAARCTPPSFKRAVNADDSSLRMRHAGAPHIDAGEQEQPHHVDEMPVPGGELEAEMLRRAELAGDRARTGRRSGRSSR